MSFHRPLHALLFLLASAFGVLVVLLSFHHTSPYTPPVATSQAACPAQTGPVHRDVFDLGAETSAAEDLGIDEMLATSSGIDVAPSSALTLADHAVSRLHDIRLGLVTPPPDA